MPSVAVALAFAAANLCQIELGPRPGVGGVFLPKQAIGPAALPSDADLARVEVSNELLKLARALESDAYADRASAQASIIARRPTPDELMALLLRKDLSDEARNVLVAILRERILTAPRGALGIRMEGVGLREGGVRITGLVAGMPAEKLLLPGDIIVSVNQVQLADRNDLIRVVQSLPPGGSVKLLVRRTLRDPKGQVQLGPDGMELTENLEFVVRLGSTDDLVERGDPIAPLAINPATLERRATAEAAAARFLPKPERVDVRRSLDDDASPRGPITLESVRALLMNYQLAGANEDAVRRFRKRLDALEAQLVQLRRMRDADAGQLAPIEETMQRTLDALDAEIREAL